MSSSGIETANGAKTLWSEFWKLGKLEPMCRVSMLA